LINILERPPPPFDKRVRYGPDPQHFAEMRLPEGQGPFPFLFVIHGGFWQSAYDLKHIGSLCAALTRGGIITCNLEYRRLGDPGGGWPGTFQDIELAVDKILQMFSSHRRIDTSRTAALGHSAGGHLALWLSGRQNVPARSPLHRAEEENLSKVFSLAGVCDLRTAWKERLGNGAVERLMGGTPEQYPDRYDAGSPIEILPTATTQVLIHGTADSIVPISQSERFVERAGEMDEHPILEKLEGVGHFDLIDPESQAGSTVVEAVLSQLDVR
jgi:acetyl esterase/lipase